MSRGIGSTYSASASKTLGRHQVALVTVQVNILFSRTIYEAFERA